MNKKIKKISWLSGIMIFSLISAAHAQIDHSTWKGTLNLETTTNVFWRFDKDTTQIFAQADSSLIEKMTFTTEPGLLFLTRVSGISPCDNQTVGKYRYIIKDGKLYLSLVVDSCSDRADAISADPYVKIK